MKDEITPLMRASRILTIGAVTLAIVLFALAPLARLILGI